MGPVFDKKYNPVDINCNTYSDLIHEARYKNGQCEILSKNRRLELDSLKPTLTSKLFYFFFLVRRS
jgi:hypothetical protein